jgi:hypothetical protein
MKNLFSIRIVFFTLFALIILGRAGEVDAWSVHIGHFWLYPLNTMCASEIQAIDINGSYGGSLYNQATSVLIPNGSPVSVGTQIAIIPRAFQNTDISWSGSGWTHDTPYGFWVSGAPNGTEPYSNVGGAALKSKVIVSPPTVTLSSGGTAGLSCNLGTKICTVTSPGTISLTLSFSATFGNLYSRVVNSTLYGVFGGICYHTKPFAVPAQNVTFNLTAVAANAVPTIPDIKSSADMTVPAFVSGTTGSPITFYFRSTDPDNDTIRYGIDWNNNNSVDQWVPSSGYVNSGTSQSVNHPWPTAGTYTFKVMAQDNKVGDSGWQSHTITISDPVYSCTGGIPINAAICSGDDTGLAVDTARSVANSCTATKCEYTCNSGYLKSGNNCIATQCNDGVDNDGDAFLDLTDPGCANADDNDEANPAPTATITAADCLIPLGSGSCTSNVTWSSTNATVRSVRQDGVQFSTAVSSALGGVNRTITSPGVHTFTFLNNGVQLASDTMTASCVSGSWDGDSCEAPAPTLTLTALTNPITAGDSTILRWTIGGTADSCWASNGWSGLQTHNTGNNQLNVSPAVTTTYTLECWNSGVSSGQQSVTVIVNPIGNLAPTANAGPNKVIALPVTTTAPSGTAASDADGSVSSTVWSFVSGPVSPTITNSTTLTPIFSSMTAAGAYVYLLTVTDNVGAVTTDTMQVTVSALVQCQSGETLNWTDVTGTLACSGISTGPEDVGEDITIGDTLTVNDGTANFICGAGGIWNPVAVSANCSVPIVLPTPPVITITATPQLIRSGDTTTVTITTTSANLLRCDIYGATPVPELGRELDNNDPFKNQITLTTKPINNKQLVSVTCTDTMTTAVGKAEAIIEVLPKIQEI